MLLIILLVRVILFNSSKPCHWFILLLLSVVVVVDTYDMTHFENSEFIPKILFLFCPFSFFTSATHETGASRFFLLFYFQKLCDVNESIIIRLFITFGSMPIANAVKIQLHTWCRIWTEKLKMLSNTSETKHIEILFYMLLFT